MIIFGFHAKNSVFPHFQVSFKFYLPYFPIHSYASGKDPIIDLKPSSVHTVRPKNTHTFKSGGMCTLL
jgi:hypothetical protein